jgi:hypothetical protein
MSLNLQQIADNEDRGVRLPCKRRRRKKLSVSPVMDDGSSNLITQASLDELLHLFANADYPSRSPIHFGRNGMPPARCAATLKAIVEDVQAVHSYHKRNSEGSGEQGCRMSTRQSGVGMDEVDRMPPVDRLHVSQQTRKEKPTCT